jgi:hypothetical protein
MTAGELMPMAFPLMRLTSATWLLNQSNSIHMNRRGGPSQTLWFTRRCHLKTSHSLYPIYERPTSYLWRSYALMPRYLTTGWLTPASRHGPCALVTVLAQSSAVALRGTPTKQNEQTMRTYTYGLINSLQCEQRSVADIIAEVATSKVNVPVRSAAALAQVCRGVITGEGPTVAGRVHFSRAIDADDTALCARILILAGRGGDPVSRAEADVLFDIDAVGSERQDGGRFDDLFSKAVVHHVMSACGRDVPGREIALALATPLDAWASAIHINAETRSWLEMRVRDMSAGGAAARAIAKAISGREPPKPPKEPTVAALFDIAA